MSEKYYCSYLDNSVSYDLENNTFSLANSKYGVFYKDVRIESLRYADRDWSLADFTHKECKHTRAVDVHTLTVRYTREGEGLKSIILYFKVSAESIVFNAAFAQGCHIKIIGDALWGTDAFPMSDIENSMQLRCAYGPAASAADNMLFDRATDSALRVAGGKKIRFRYDWAKKCYTLSLTTGVLDMERKFRFEFENDVMAKRYHLPYAPLSKKRGYTKPPVGWMTWYAVKFDACEENVLENAEWQAKHLKAFGADTLWVDWEWYHDTFDAERTDGVNSLLPDKTKYPHGLKYVSDKIKALGLRPALWIGYTHEPGMSEFIQKNPEVVLHKETSWCGTYFYDFTNPKFLNDYLPKAVQNVLDWGYSAVKFDTIPIALQMHEEHHDKMYDPGKTTFEAYRNVVKKTREILGEDVYMLSCSGSSDRAVLWGADVFDAARVGDDIFSWEDFLKAGVQMVMRYYPLHNIALYADPDNLVMREEHNTYAQAASRAYFVSMLGLPMTFGDVLPALPEERVDLIRRCLPVLDIHPMDVKRHTHDLRVLTINLNVELPFENYTVLDVFNLQETDTEYKVRLGADLYLDEGCYHVYDYTKKEYLGIVNEALSLELAACESCILCLRPVKTHPQIISTSRHITQGAAEIKALSWNGNKLSLTSELVANDLYTVTLFVPDGYTPKGDLLTKSKANLYTCSFIPTETKPYDFEFEFESEA